MNKINSAFTRSFQEGKTFNRAHRAIIYYRDTPGGRMNLPFTGHVEFPDIPLMHYKPMVRFALFYNSVVAVLLHPNRLALSAQGWGDKPTTRNLLNAFLEAYQIPGYFHQKRHEFCYCGQPFDDRAVFVFNLLDRRLEAVAMPHANHPILMGVD